jgi:anti-anti-sigma factor
MPAADPNSPSSASQLKLSHQTVQATPKILSLALVGEYDHSNGRAAEAYFDDMLKEESPKHVLLDLTGLTFAASIFFSALLFWKEALGAGGGKLVVFAPTSEVLSTMRLFTMDRVVTTCPDRQAALAAVGG